VTSQVRLRSIWRHTAEARGRGTTTKSTNERADSRVTTHSTHNQSTSHVDDVGCGQHPRLLVSSDPSLQATVNTRVLPGRFVEMLLRQHGAPLDVEADLEHGGKGVGEIA
jgi:hypothetical protein